MLDPVQREVLNAARKGGVEVSGGPGTGKSRLANALAADAAARGLTCLLVGDDDGLDKALDVHVRIPIQPILSARLGASFGTTAGSGFPANPLAMRASLFPDEAALAKRLIERSREIQSEHGFDPAEVVKAESRRMPSPKTMALIGVACAEAALVADALWGGNARSGRTLADVVAAIAGTVSGPAPDDDAVVAARGGDAFERLASEMADGVEEATVPGGLDDLRRTLDPWAWGNAQTTLAGLHASLAERASAFTIAASLLREHGTMDRAIAACPPDGHAGQALANYARSFPGVDGREAEASIRRHAIREVGRADAVASFLVLHADARLADIEAAKPRAGRGDASLALIQELRSVRDAAKRLSAMLPDLRQALPQAAFDVVRSRPIDDVAAGIAQASAETERTRALREMAGIRGAFAKTGFGDVLTAGTTFDAALAAARKLDDAPRLAPASPRMLDLLMGDGKGAPDEERAWPAGVTRWQPAKAAMPETRTRWDVIVVDDAASVTDSEMARLRAMTSSLHLVGVERGTGIELPVPHRSLSGPLSNLGRPKGERGWAGGPGGSGVVVRTVAEGTDLDDARMTALVAVRAAGVTAVDAKSGMGSADVVILAADRVGEADIVAAGARARQSVLVLARECFWQPADLSDAAVPEDERALASAGWVLVANAQDGRVYANDERSVIVTDEPDGFDLLAENVAERVARLSRSGWSPIVAWRGSPRGADDMLRLVERRAVTNGAHLDMELATFTLPGPRAAPAQPVARSAAVLSAPLVPQPLSLSCEDVPASTHREGSFQDVVWRLKWIREEVLLKRNPDRDACLLTDERILGLVRMGIDDEGMWQAKVRGALLRGVDYRQLAVRDAVMDVVGTMARLGIRRETLGMVASVDYQTGIRSAVPAGSLDGNSRLGEPFMVVGTPENDAPAPRM